MIAVDPPDLAAKTGHDEGSERRIELLKPDGDPYRLLVLRGVREYARARVWLQRLGFALVAPRPGVDEVYRQLRPPPRLRAPSAH